MLEFLRTLPGLTVVALLSAQMLRAADAVPAETVDRVTREVTQAVEKATREVTAQVQVEVSRAQEQAAQAVEEAAAQAEVETQEELEPEPKAERPRRRGEVVEFGQAVTIGPNETAPTVVVFFENARIEGTVGTVVAIFGSVEVLGRVNNEAVAIMGRIHVGPKGRISRQAVSIGGKVEREKGGRVRGQVVSIPVPGYDEISIQLPEKVRRAVSELVFKARPLSFRVPWSWAALGVFSLVYLLVLAVFPRATARVTSTLDARPAGAFLMGLAAIPLGLMLALLVAVTGIGVLTWPLLFAALMVAAVFGKASVATHLGASIGRQFGAEKTAPLLAFLVGLVVLTGFYLVPFLGCIAWIVATMWGLGAATLAFFSSFRDEMPKPDPQVPIRPYKPPQGSNDGPSVPPAASASGGMGLGDSTSASPGATEPGASLGGASATGSFAGTPPAPMALTEVRAGFWRKAGATFIDVAVLALATGWALPGSLILWVVYYAAMVAWKGTTIGGLVLGLRVVRLDGRPMDLPTAVVRALGGALGSMVCFLGVLWCAWDPEKQGWHDKMAGTVVVHTSAAQALV